MGIMLLPLHGVLFFVSLAAHVLVIAALVDAATRPAGAFVAADKWTKPLWMIGLFLGFFLIFVGVIAAIVYFLDVRPAVRVAGGGGGGAAGRGGGSSSDGPYGPFRG
jgi:hypothetical protein